MNKELILNRHSTRSFKKEALQNKDLNKLNDFITSLNIPKDINIKIISNKIGTYGFIKNPAAYLITYCKNKPKILETIGYYLENIVLYATSLNIGTCYLGATFSKKQIKKQERMLQKVNKNKGFKLNSNFMLSILNTLI